MEHSRTVTILAFDAFLLYSTRTAPLTLLPVDRDKLSPCFTLLFHLRRATTVARTAPEAGLSHVALLPQNIVPSSGQPPYSERDLQTDMAGLVPLGHPIPAFHRYDLCEHSCLTPSPDVRNLFGTNFDSRGFPCAFFTLTITMTLQL